MPEENLFEKSLRVNGWGEPLYLSNRSESSKSLDDLTIDRTKIKPYLIDSVEEFVKVITRFKIERQNPIFYRGHLLANYLNLPASFRKEKVGKENILVKEFQKRFPKECNDQDNTFEQLALMQHYGLATRLLDVTESPLAVLYFACKPNLKFNRSHEKTDNNWGTILLYNAPQEASNAIDLPSETAESELKYSNSNTASIIANTALCEESFEYGKLDMLCLKDGKTNIIEDFIYFKDIISRSIMVRSPLNNKRMQNQQGAFILCNANQVIKMPKAASISKESFTNNVISEKGPKNLADIHNKKIHEFGNCDKWDFGFKKVVPYSLDNPIKQFRDDPFDIRRLLFKDDSKRQVVFFIPPQDKKHILNQLEILGITDSFIYPEMDTVAYELNQIIQ